MKRANTRISILLKEQLDQKLWYERLNLVNKFKRFCQRCAGDFTFWVAVGAFSTVEPILCSYRPVGIILYAQLAVLTASSVLYVIQLVGCASREWDKIVMIQAMSSSKTIITVQDFTPFKVLIFFSAEGEYILEFCCLLGGWVTIFFHPGLAVLRCFRVFRLLWFYEVMVFKTTIEDTFDPLLGAEFVARCFKVLRFSNKALTALGNEMFRLTNATRGGLLLMLMFFYSAFVLGTSLWIETNGTSEFCMTKTDCVYTLMRLTFYDGTGFDFTYSLVRNHTFLFFLCIAYMCVTSFGILNGLVGIFGTLFQTASDDAFNDPEADGNSSDGGSGSDDDAELPDDDEGDNGAHSQKKRTHRLASLVFRAHSVRGLDLSEDDDEGRGDKAGEGEGLVGTNSGGGSGGVRATNDGVSVNAVPFTQKRLSSPRAEREKRPLRHSGDRTRAYVLSDDDNSLVGAGSITGAGEAEGDGDGEVWAYGSDDESPRHPPAVSVAAGTTGAGAARAGNVPPISRDSSKRDISGSSRRDAAAQQAQQQTLAKSQYGSFSVAEKADVQRRLAGKLGGASNFALMELKKMAAQESPSSAHHHKAYGSQHDLHVQQTQEPRREKEVDGTRKDTGKVYPTSAGIADVTDHSLEAPIASVERRHQHHIANQIHGVHHQGHGHRHHAAPAAAHGHGQGHNHGHGMFGGAMRRQQSHRSIGAHSSAAEHRPNPFAPKVTSHGHGHGPHAARDNTAELKALTQQVQTLSRTVEVQNDMIIALFSQIQLSLRQQQQQQQQQQTPSTTRVDDLPSHPNPIHHDYTQGSTQSHNETEILFPEMAPSKNMAEHVARYLSAVSPIHPNAHAKPQSSHNLHNLHKITNINNSGQSLPHAESSEQDLSRTHVSESVRPITDGLRIETSVLEKHKQGTQHTALNSPVTPLTPMTLGTRSSTSTTSAEMSAFSLLASDLRNK